MTTTPPPASLVLDESEREAVIAYLRVMGHHETADALEAATSAAPRPAEEETTE